MGIAERFPALKSFIILQCETMGLVNTNKSVLSFKVPRKSEYALGGILLRSGIAVFAGTEITD